VEHLLILDELLRKERWAEALLEGAEKARAKMTIFSAENEAGEKLAGFGGVAALLRFRIE
jgi:protein pelota